MPHSFEGAAASAGGLSPEPIKGGKRSAWIAHIKSVAKAKGIKFGEAMKIASKSFKGGGGCGASGPMEGGSGIAMGPLGGRRRGATKKKHRRGGSLYGFGGGDGNGAADGSLADGAGRYGDMGDATWHAPGGSSLTGAGPASAPAAGGRRSRRRHRRRRGSSRTAKVGGKRRR